MTNAQQIYARSVRRLPASEQLRLAALILKELAQATPSQPAISSLDYLESLPPVAPPRRSILEILESRPVGGGLFKTSAEADEYLRQERDSWER